jgi:hypothetical protein
MPMRLLQAPRATRPVGTPCWPPPPTRVAVGWLRAAILIPVLLGASLTTILLVSHWPPFVPTLRDARTLGTWYDPLVWGGLLTTSLLSWQIGRRIEIQLITWFRPTAVWVAHLLTAGCIIVSLGTTLLLSAVLFLAVLLSAPDLVQSVQVANRRIDLIQRPAFDGSRLFLAITLPDGSYTYQHIDDRAVGCRQLSAEPASGGIFLRCDAHVVASVHESTRLITVRTSQGQYDTIRMPSPRMDLP